MQFRWAALALVLALCAATPKSAAGQQDTQPRGRKLGNLGQNYPNPFKPDTYIPFTIDDCNGPNGQHRVTLRIYNVLAQLVAVPHLHGAGRPLVGLPLSCGEYLGYWDGRVGRRGGQAASGVYVYELVIDGQRSSRKMFVAR
jgi:hypothetical protein